VNEVHWAATGYNPITKEMSAVPAKIVLLLDSPEKVDDFLEEYRKWNKLPEDSLKKRGKAHYTWWEYDTGSTVTVLSHAVEPLKLEGSQWTHIFADEPPPQKVFNAIFRGARIKGRPAKVLLAGTPIMGSWLRKDVHDPWVRREKGTEHIECFKGHSSQNKHNDKGWLDRFGAKLSDKEKKIRLEGEFFDLSGQALAHLFDRDVHILPKEFKWEKTNPIVVAIDPHAEKPHVACIVGADRDNYLYYLDEISLKLTPRDFARELRRFYADYRLTDIVCDNYGSQPMLGGEGFKSFIDVLREEGVRVRPTTWDEKKDDAFISRIQDCLVLPDEEDNLGRVIPKLRIMPHCRGIIRDIEEVSWQQDRRNDITRPKLEISNRDFLATLKYALAANIHFKKGNEEIVYKELPSTYTGGARRDKHGFSLRYIRDQRKAVKEWEEF